MQEGTEETIRIKFKANPKPTIGTWKIGETTVPIGASSVDSKFSSSQVNPAVSTIVLLFFTTKFVF